MRYSKTLAVCGVLFVAACAPFPDHGSGGFAEHRPTLNPDYVWDPADWASDPSAEPRFQRLGRKWAVLHDDGWTTYQVDRLACTDLRLDALLSRGVRDRFPAHVWRAMRERRIALRLLSGGLEWDGERRLSAYEDTVSQLVDRMAIDPADIRDSDPGQSWRIDQCSSVSKP